ncbi:hypothetical protein BGZ83_009364 [Gryganskiella cystojenkinii]|nr:hypothetical protein BGZ83_009364 [Gryganskiella cystojenkinii]
MQIAIQDSDTCPVITSKGSQDFVVMTTQRSQTQTLPQQTTLTAAAAEFMTDPEDTPPPLHQPEPALVSKALPLLLLRVNATKDDEIQFEFTLQGKRLDSLWAHDRQTQRRSRNESSTSTTSSTGTSTSTSTSSNGNEIDQEQQNKNDEDEDDLVFVDKMNKNPRNGHDDPPKQAARTGIDAAVQNVTPLQHGSSVCTTTAPEDANSSNNAPPSTIYFVTTRSEQALRSLLQGESERRGEFFEKQSTNDSPATRSPGTGINKSEAAPRDTRLSLRPAHPPSTSLMPASSKNPRHWRRSSTPEKNVARLPSFWSKLPSLTNNSSNNSLPSLQDVVLKQAPDTSISMGTVERLDTASMSTSIQLANDTEDGPLFRATVVECENHIRNMKVVVKQVQKATQTLLESRRAWVLAEQAFAKEMAGLKVAEPLLDNYLRPMTQNIGELSELLSQQTRDLFVQPFSTYWLDIKAAEIQRKQFEDESKDYYNFLSKYMAMKQENVQKKIDADQKYEQKRRHFEIKRMEYWMFLTEMRAGASKDEWLASHLANYLDKHCQYLTDLGTVSREMRPALTSATSLQDERREKKVRKRHSNSSLLNGGEGSPLTETLVGSSEEFSGITSILNTFGDQNGQQRRYRSPSQEARVPRARVLTGPSEMPGRYPPPMLNSNTSAPSVTGFRDLEHQDIEAGIALGRRKEGFLFATSRPNSHNATVLDKPNINWHKYWCVLSEGQLHEYSHWKKGVTQPHNEPINLRIATVRPCRNQDRRFCFEVITPRFRRVYQATSVEDMNSWISVISNAIHGMLNGTSSCRNLNLQYTTHQGMTRSSGENTPPEGKGMLAGLGGMARTSMEQVLNATSLPTSLQTRVQPGQAVGKKRGGSAADGLNELGQIMLPKAWQSLTPDEMPSMDQLGVQLLQLMRESHEANTVCADCGARNPDWCVINLGILVCIECSGIHRSLGTHISKVRSFNLDTTSYTRDLFDFIRSVGNDISNKIWEARLFTEQSSASLKDLIYFQKPIMNDSREHKVAFIRKKYVDRAFVATWDGPAIATSALFRAVEENDVAAAIKAYAAGANLNAAQKANKDADSGPFFEEQLVESAAASSDAPPPLPPRQVDDTFGLGMIPKVTESPILSDGVLWKTAISGASVEDTNESDTGSSRFSRSTSESMSADQKMEHVIEPRPRDRPQGSTWEVVPRPTLTGRPISSVMVMQTSPLLMALRQGTPFSQDETFEVYPMAEFLIQNGAASNMSVQVKVLENIGSSSNRGTATSSSSLPTRSPPGRGGNLVVPEGIIEQDVPLAASTSTSIVSRLSESTAPTSFASGYSMSTSTSFDINDGGDEDVVRNRRSVGQVLEMRGESGASAMEYLRFKAMARGEVVRAPSPSPSPTPPTAAEAIGPLGSGAAMTEYSLSNHGKSNAAVSSFNSSYLTLTPRFQPGRASVLPSASAPVSLAPSPTLSGMATGAFSSPTQSLFGATSTAPRYPTTVQEQDYSTLFQKRRESDSGLGSVLFSARRRETDKDRIAAKAKARMSGDFSLLQPVSIFSSFSSPRVDRDRDHDQHSHHPHQQDAQGIDRAISPPLPLSQSSTLSGDAISSPDIPSSSDQQGTTTTPSRAQKVRNSFTKSLRLSAAYLKNNMSLRDDHHKDYPHSSAATASSNVLATGSTTMPTKHGRISATSSQLDFEPVEVETEDGGGEELTMEELLRQQDQQLQQQRVAWDRAYSPTSGGGRGGGAGGGVSGASRTSLSSISLSLSAPTLVTATRP